MGIPRLKNQSSYMVPLILALVVIGYLPVLIGDYVPQDQWRAFTYGLNIDGISKWTACVNDRLDFFILTGRPLVWIPECIEHGFIHDIGDFKFLRLFTLPVILITMLICGFVFRAIAGSYWRAVYLSVPVVVVPGYAFMYYQGMTAGGVLASVAFATASVYFSLSNFEKQYLAKKRILSWGVSGGIFMLALLNYPSFAFIAFPVIFFCVFYEKNRSLKNRLIKLQVLYLFYGLVCIVYFFACKLLSQFVPPQDLEQYQFSFVDLSTIIQKVIAVFGVLFNNGVLINIDSVPYLGIVAIIGASIFVPSLPAKTNVWRKILPPVTFLLLFPTVAIFSSAPVILSNFVGLPTRQVYPGTFMFGFAGLLTLMRFSELFFEKISSPVIGCSILLLVLAPIAVQQNRIITDLLHDSAIEVKAIRSAADELVNEGNWAAGKHIHVLRPTPGSFSQQFTWFNSGEYAPATTQNPSHLKEMFTMALRERLGQEEISKIYFRDCRLELDCGTPPPQPFELVVTQSIKTEPSVPWNAPYKIVDLSSLALLKEAQQ